MRSNRRIGILTHHYIKNYGAFLQAYALQETLAGLYPSSRVEIINYVNIKHYLSNLRPFLASKPRSKNPLKAVMVFIEDKKQLYKFWKAKKYLKLSPRCWSADDINKQKYDVIVIGSDEVWSIDPIISFDKIKFGVGLDCPNIISYAASAGSLRNIHSLPDFISESLRRFRKISARDDITRNVATRYYKGNVQLVLDPTFLLDFDMINISESIPNVSYILVYQCQLDAERVRMVRRFASDNNLLILGAGCYEDWFDLPMLNISPFTLVRMFDRADYVVTGAFHGVIFAIKAKKRFVAFPTMINRIEKIKSFLSLVGLEDRLINDMNKTELCDRLVRIIENEKIMKTIDRMKHESIAFLREGIL